VSGYNFIDYATQDGVAYITLNRPGRLNAVHAAMSEELLDAEERVLADPSVKVLIYRGAGRAFCSGRDLKEMASEQDQQLKWMAEGGWCRPWSFPKVTIAAVHGHAVGGGALLATSCDVTIAAEDAVFGYPEGYLGMGAMDGHPWIWLLGPKLAKDYLLTGRLFDAREAERVGLVNTVVGPDEDLDFVVRQRAERIVEAEARAPGFSTLTKLSVNMEFGALMSRSYYGPRDHWRRQAGGQFEMRQRPL
jgi:enoyl-CoA hydratase